MLVWCLSCYLCVWALAAKYSHKRFAVYSAHSLQLPLSNMFVWCPQLSWLLVFRISAGSSVGRGSGGKTVKRDGGGGTSCACSNFPLLAQSYILICHFNIMSVVTHACSVPGEAFAAFLYPHGKSIRAGNCRNRAIPPNIS